MPGKSTQAVLLSTNNDFNSIFSPYIELYVITDPKLAGLSFNLKSKV